MWGIVGAFSGPWAVTRGIVRVAGPGRVTMKGPDGYVQVAAKMGETSLNRHISLRPDVADVEFKRLWILFLIAPLIPDVV